MASVHDVAAYILKRLGPLPAMKLHKLVYYTQAWSLVWDDAPLFKERIEAWVNGPAVPALYEKHRGNFEVKSWPSGSIQKLTTTQKETIDAVLRAYGGRSTQWLSDLTHSEDPWCDARKGLAAGQRGHEAITHAALAEYYGSLSRDDGASSLG